MQHRFVTSALTSVLALLAVTTISRPLMAENLNASAIDAALGRSGRMQAGDVYRVGFPRNDLRVEVDGVALKPGLALGSYAVFKQYGSSVLMMGDLVLLPSEIASVMTSLEKNGIQITALHNHLLRANPPVFYMHYMGMGDATMLATALRQGLQLSATPLGPAAPATSPEPVWFENAVEHTLDHQGKLAGGVLSISVPRAVDEMTGGLSIPPAMGTSEVMNFQDAGNKRVATTGDFSLTADEVNPVTRALRDHNIEVEALHMHMLDDSPRLFYLHFWAVGDPTAVARVFPLDWSWANAVDQASGTCMPSPALPGASPWTLTE